MIVLAGKIGRVLFLVPLILALALPAARPVAAGNYRPSITLSPPAGPPGTDFVVIGTGFPPNTAITLNVSLGFEQSRSQAARSDALGSLYARIDSTDFAQGEHPVGADGGYPAVPVAEAYLTITPAGRPIPPAIVATPQFGVAGTFFTLRGEYFPGKTALTVVVAGPGGFRRTFPVGSDAPGSFSLVIDSTGFPPGPYSVTATGQYVGAELVPGRFAVVEGGGGTGPGENGARCYAETGKCLGGRFLAYWDAHGGLALNGYPISDELVETLADGKSYTVQYCERVRLEYHPENPQPYDVLLGQFGRLLHPADPPAPFLAGGRYFPETGHNVPPRFAAYWERNGGLAQFGLPLSEMIRERLDDGQEYDVQYFEHARFELHPENAAPYDVLLGQFGRRFLPGGR